MKQFQQIRKVLERISRRTKAVFLCGLFFSLCLAALTGVPFLGDGKALAEHEMTIHWDVQCLYEASQRATWADAPRWWVGRWNSTTGYYRPMTSMLFLAEQKTFGLDFDAFNRISLLMHCINAGLLFSLAFLVLRGNALVRLVAGLVAVYFFATPASSYHFAVQCTLKWWPAQNDPLCLMFGLLSLVLLQYYLNHGTRKYYWLSIFAFFLSIAAKELGHITMPIAICLIWNARRKPSREMLTFAILGVFMYLFRKAVVPHTWDPVFGRVALDRGLRQWLGPLYQQYATQNYWTVASAAAVLMCCYAGIRYRWRWWVVAALSLVLAGLAAQFLCQDGTWAQIFVGQSPQQIASDLVYLLACALFWRYRKEEPGVAAGILFFVSYIPILGFAGLYYYYWPSAFLGFADAVFFACLVRFAHDRWLQSHPKIEPTLELAPTDLVIEQA